MTTFRIVRRAFSQWTLVEEFTGKWHEAECRAMQLQAERRDGEYSTRFPGEPLESRPNDQSCPVQTAWAFL